MLRYSYLRRFPLVLFIVPLLASCDQNLPAGNANGNTLPANASNAANYSNSNSSPSTSAVDAKEPAKYQATVKLSLEAIGDKQNTSLPAIGAVVARNGSDRRMEFVMPNNEKVVYLDTDGKNYLILPNRKQYAELNKESTGFEVRQLLMPENMIEHIKKIQGIQQSGEETTGGRQAIKYTYNASAETQTQAGRVDTTAFILVDKETGLPLRSETLSQTASNSNVQGYKGIKFVTEMTDIVTNPDLAQFELPAGYSKIDPEQVRSQVNLVFQAVAAIVGQAMKQMQPTPAASPTATAH